MYNNKEWVTVERGLGIEITNAENIFVRSYYSM